KTRGRVHLTCISCVVGDTCPDDMRGAAVVAGVAPVAALRPSACGGALDPAAWRVDAGGVPLRGRTAEAQGSRTPYPLAVGRARPRRDACVRCRNVRGD